MAARAQKMAPTRLVLIALTMCASLASATVAGSKIAALLISTSIFG
jgi:hypothetical protein